MSDSPKSYAFGDLNPIQRTIAAPKLQHYRDNPIGAMRAAAIAQFTAPAPLSGPFKAICLRVEPDLPFPSADSWVSRYFDGYSDQGQSVAGLIRIKARIPELHAMLPEPAMYGNTPGPHQKLIDMHPTFVGQHANLQKPKEGDLIWVTFGSIENMQDPIYLTSVFPDPMPGAAGQTAQPQKCGSVLQVDASLPSFGVPMSSTTSLGAMSSPVSLPQMDSTTLALLSNIFSVISVFEGSYDSIGKDYEWEGFIDEPRYDSGTPKLAKSYEEGVSKGVYIVNDAQKWLVHPAFRYVLDDYKPYPASRYNGTHVPGFESVTMEKRGNHIGLSYGFIQFTQKAGSLGKVLQYFKQLDQDSFYKIFGNSADELLNTLTATGPVQQLQASKLEPGQVPAPGDTHSTCWGFEYRMPSCMPVGGIDIWTGHWLDKFKRAATEAPAMQKAQQMVAAEDYAKASIEVAKETGITSELGLALLIDRAVNAGNGGMKDFYRNALQSVQGTDQERFGKIFESKGDSVKERMKKLFVYDKKSESGSLWQDYFHSKPWLKMINLGWQSSAIFDSGGSMPSSPVNVPLPVFTPSSGGLGTAVDNVGSLVSTAPSNCQNNLGCGVMSVSLNTGGSLGGFTPSFPGGSSMMVPTNVDITQFHFGLPASVNQGLPFGSEGREAVTQVFGDIGPYKRKPGTERNLIINPIYEQNNMGSTKPLFWGEKIYCHKYMIAYLEYFFDKLMAEGLVSQQKSSSKASKPLEPGKLCYFGCFSARFTTQPDGNYDKPNISASSHSWGIAFDINSPWIHMGKGLKWDPAIIHPRIIEIATREVGFGWLGGYDAMHFELADRGCYIENSQKFA